MKVKAKLKTHRGAAKRFKVTSTGKIMRHRSGKRHLLGTKKPKRMRRLGKAVQVNPADARDDSSYASLRQVKFYKGQAERYGCLPAGSVLQALADFIP